MENRNFISVILPFYNAKAYLKSAIQSVLEQSHKHWELIMVDDGSTDNSILIAKKYTDNKKIFLLQHPKAVNKGVAESRALAIRFSKGYYVSFLDSDDLYTPVKLETCLNAFVDNPEVILVHHAANFIDNSKKQKAFFNEFRFDKINTSYNFLDVDYLNNNHICNSSVVIKSEYLKKINNSFPHLFQYEDWINWILLAEHGNYYYLNEELCTYRFHENSSTYKLLEEELKAMYAKFEMLMILNKRVKGKELKKNVEAAVSKQLEMIEDYYDFKNEREAGDTIKPLSLNRSFFK